MVDVEVERENARIEHADDTQEKEQIGYSKRRIALNPYAVRGKTTKKTTVEGVWVQRPVFFVLRQR